MSQLGFFDVANRYAELDARNDPLLKIDKVVPWEDFRPHLKAVWRKPANQRPLSGRTATLPGSESSAGRKPWDVVVMFKAIILCALYNLSDNQVEYQIRDRLSFVRFLGLGLENKVPDAKTVWLYREQLAQAGMIATVFENFDSYLKDRGYLAMGGQIIDASIVSVPTQHNKRDENTKIKAGETPQDWVDKPARLRQKDTDAPSRACKHALPGRGWIKKHGKSHYGYKNHINVDRRHKLVRCYHVTDAAVHDSQVIKDLLDMDNTASEVWADSAFSGYTRCVALPGSAYRSSEIEEMLAEKGLTSRIHRKGRRNRPLTKREERSNKTRSKIRVRVEHIFGSQSNDMGGTLVRSIGTVRAKAHIGLKNLAYNMRRLIQLEHLATEPP